MWWKFALLISGVAASTEDHLAEALVAVADRIAGKESPLDVTTLIPKTLSVISPLKEDREDIPSKEDVPSKEDIPSKEDTPSNLNDVPSKEDLSKEDPSKEFPSKEDPPLIKMDATISEVLPPVLDPNAPGLHLLVSTGLLRGTLAEEDTEVAFEAGVSGSSVLIASVGSVAVVGAGVAGYTRCQQRRPQSPYEQFAYQRGIAPKSTPILARIFGKAKNPEPPRQYLPVN